jgi:hypothetical protein
VSGTSLFSFMGLPAAASANGMNFFIFPEKDA